FCGAKPLTKEHMLPKWLRDLLGSNQLMHRHGVEGPEQTYERSEWEATPASQTLKLLCSDCNNNWGGSIEAAAKPILLPMIRGEETRLTREKQAVVSLWMAKTMMVFDRSHPRTSVIPEDDLRYVRANNEPPPAAVGWLSNYSGEKYVAVHVSSTSPYAIPGENASDPGWVSSLVLESLMMQMVKRPGLLDDAPRFFDETGDLNVQVWPPPDDHIVWPPTRAKDDAFVEAVSFPTGEAPK
ncbi:MAG: hypothetical protein ACRD1T_26755, partial [Acidimicrobiia bacterium]